MTLSTIEQQIVAEWNVARAFIATHQTLSLGAVGVVLWALGHFHIPF